MGVIVIFTGGRHHVVSVKALAFLERTLRTLGAKEIHTAGSDGVAAQVEAVARTRGIAVRRVTAKWMHDGPANVGDRTITLAGIARTVIALPDEAATEDLLTRARKRRLRIIRKVRADRWLTGRRWIGGSSPCQADRTSGSEFPPSLMNSPASSRIIRSEDADAVTQLQAKIAAAEKLQVVMKAANQIVRNPRLTDDEKVAQIVATCGLRGTSARELLKPDFGGRFGFPGYSLTNNSANIRRMQQRLKGLANESGRSSMTLSFPGGRVEDNAEACRVRIYHDAKPPADTIGKLRTYGFHWTPSRACWQRLRNDSARYAATQITGVSWPEVAPVASFEPSIATVNTVTSGHGVRAGFAA